MSGDDFAGNLGSGEEEYAPEERARRLSVDRFAAADDREAQDVEALTADERAVLDRAACRAHSGPDMFLCRPCADAHDAAVLSLLAARERAGAEKARAAADYWQQKWKRRGLVIARLTEERDRYRHEAAEHLALLDGKTAHSLIERDRADRIARGGESNG